eukprot:jgi/Psemu1/31019/gm1.31019_g
MQEQHSKTCTTNAPTATPNACLQRHAYHQPTKHPLASALGLQQQGPMRLSLPRKNGATRLVQRAYNYQHQRAYDNHQHGNHLPHHQRKAHCIYHHPDEVNDRTEFFQGRGPFGEAPARQDVYHQAIYTLFTEADGDRLLPLLLDIFNAQAIGGLGIFQEDAAEVDRLRVIHGLLSQT